MNIRKEDINEIKDIQKGYMTLHKEIFRLNEVITSISNDREKVSNELIELRGKEKSLINKIEKEIGRELTQDDLIKILQDEN